MQLVINNTHLMKLQLNTKKYNQKTKNENGKTKNKYSDD